MCWLGKMSNRDDTEDQVFKVFAYASTIQGAVSADEDGLAGDEPRRFTNAENAPRDGDWLPLTGVHLFGSLSGMVIIKLAEKRSQALT